jgi:Cu-Zn family superoxide dismutase
MPKARLIAVGAVAVLAMVVGAVVTLSHDAPGTSVRADLRGPTGDVIGSVQFSDDDHDRTDVRLVMDRAPTREAALDAFHGFHVHANDDPANGSGCIADGAAPSNTWFVSADGHWSKDPAVHGMHTGDMPSVLLNKDGTARLDFTTERMAVADLVGKAVVLHSGEDNFANVPTGTAPDQYTPNGSVASDKTHKTGNAGDRIACGVVAKA